MSNGKGSTQRPTNRAQYNANYIEAFGEPCKVCGKKVKTHFMGVAACPRHQYTVIRAMDEDKKDG